jgi:4-amino-4-deoxy-L-arabinose transferase-like glycosyltransferase
MICLAGRPLWYDEAFAVLYASLSPEGMVYGTVMPAQGTGAADVHPLLYYFLLHGWMKLVGQSPLAVRFLSLILGMVTVALLWRLANWCFGARTGLAVGLLGATNPFHVAYSQEARMYALLGLGAVTAAWGLLRALAGAESRRAAALRSSPGDVDRPRLLQSRAHWSLFVVGSAVTLYAHNLGAFILLALHLLVVARPRWRRHLPRLILADLIALLLFSPWLVKVLPGQIGFVERGYWLSSPGIEEVVRAVMLPVLTFYEPAPTWLVGIGLFTGFLLLALLATQAPSRSRAGWFLLLCWIPILSLLSLSLWKPLYLERALLPSGLFYLVAIGWLLARDGLPRILRMGLAVLLTVSTLGSLGVHYTYDGFPRPPFEQAVAYLRTNVEPDDAVVHTNKLTYFPMHYYAPRLAGAFLGDPPGSPQDTLAYPTQEALGIFATPTITEAVGTARCAWLVYFPREVTEAETVAGEHPVLGWVEERFVQVNQERFSDLVIALYRREDQ